MIGFSYAYYGSNELVYFYLSLSLRVIGVTLMFGLKFEVWMSGSKEHVSAIEVSISEYRSTTRDVTYVILIQSL